MDTITLFKNDFYQRIGGLNFLTGKVVLDVGCGDGQDSIAIAKYAKSVTGLDIVKDKQWGKVHNKKVSFVVGKAEKIPFKDNSFTGLFLKDVLHHVENLELSLKEIKRVTTKDANIFLIEANRYNPLFYFHMTKIRKHEHLTQKKFKEIVHMYFPHVKFIHFESHYIPFLPESLFKTLIVFEKLISNAKVFRKYLSYNVAVISNDKKQRKRRHAVR